MCILCLFVVSTKDELCLYFQLLNEYCTNLDFLAYSISTIILEFDNIIESIRNFKLTVMMILNIIIGINYEINRKHRFYSVFENYSIFKSYWNLIFLLNSKDLSLLNINIL